jgi:hypothetical protein
MSWGKLVDMEMDDESKMDSLMPIAMATKPDYPYGLCICLTHEELAKLGLDADCDVGDVLRFMAEAVVTCKSASDSEMGGPMCRIELQIQRMAVSDEDMD